MSEFRVWAPAAHTLELVLPERRVTMNAGPDEWWSVPVSEARAGQRYWFSVDGRAPRPDPRSPSQPDGVHGPSAVVDHTSFDWTDAGWQPVPLPAAVFYELHVGTFTPQGTFDGVRDHLDHLLELGVTHVELMPVAEFPGQRGWGYDGADLFAPHHAYGGPDGLKRLVDTCHARGLAVVLDVVYNHLGPSGNYLSEFGPYFTQRYATPWGQAVNLDGPGSDEVRRFLIDNACMWLRDYHVDGLRLDAVHALVDTSALHFLEELAAQVHALQGELGRHKIVVAESDLNDPRLVRAPEVGGYGLDAQWSDDLHHALHAVLTGERSGYYEDFGDVGHVVRALGSAFVYDGIYSPHRGRRHGRTAQGLPGHRFVVSLQNHDQVGNRARGDRLHQQAGRAAAEVGAAILLTSPFLPLIFQGQEWAASTPFPYFTDHEDEALGQAVREGRRREFARFGWKPEDIPDPQAEATFASAKLDWGEPERAPHAQVLASYKALLRLRRERPELRQAAPEALAAWHDDEQGWLVVARAGLVLACTLGHKSARLDLHQFTPVSALELASNDAVRWDGRALELPPQSFAILSRWHP